MRFVLAGFILLLIPISALAQAKGEVESIGFENTYRPACWTPMLVKLVPTTGDTGTYQIQVVQEDLDGDRVTYYRTITLTGNAEGQAPREQRFWMYFIPEPTKNGLPGRGDSDALRQLRERVHVFLCTDTGKELTELPITATISSVDYGPSGKLSASPRGTKLIIAVSEGSSQPFFEDMSDVYGMVENIELVRLRPAGLPENIIGYEGVDALLWLDASPPDPNNPTEADRVSAIRDYVRQGGRLVISQPAEWQKTLTFGEMLPVNLSNVVDVKDLDPLLSMVRTRDNLKPTTMPTKNFGPFKLGLADAKPGAVVTDWAYPGEASKQTPYIVRAPYGLGSISWVAQDLGNPNIGRAFSRQSWVDIWTRVFDWNNDPMFASKIEAEQKKVEERYGGASSADFGQAMISGMNLTGKVASYVSVAIIFFILYFVAAGPGGYLFLMHNKKVRQSWFLYAATALIAAALTVLVVRVLLRGAPKVAHLSLVRAAPGEPTIVDSRFGLYIPRDGEQEIKLDENAKETVSYVTPFAMHPDHKTDKEEEVLSAQAYKIPVHDAASDDPVAVRIPYRSTMKKLQSHWVGTLPDVGGIEGLAKLREQGFIEGRLTNATGDALRQVYIVFNYPQAEGQRRDWVLYIPSWDKGATIDLNNEFKNAKPINTTTGDVPESGKTLKGMLLPNGGETEWVLYWYRKFRSTNYTEIDTSSDASDGWRRSFVLLSLFDRLPPVRASQQNGDRFELRRKGVRRFNISQAIGAGQLVVLGQTSNTPLPVPMQVDGEKPVTENGTTFYQFVIPLDRSAVDKPPATTQETKKQVSRIE